MSSSETKAIIPFLTDDAQEALCSAVGACLQTTGISSRQRGRLKHQLRNKKSVLRALSKLSPQASRQEKTKLLTQAGGFPGLGILISAAIPLITSLISKAVKK